MAAATAPNRHLCQGPITPVAFNLCQRLGVDPIIQRRALTKKWIVRRRTVPAARICFGAEKTRPGRDRRQPPTDAHRETILSAVDGADRRAFPERSNLRHHLDRDQQREHELSAGARQRRRIRSGRDRRRAEFGPPAGHPPRLAHSLGIPYGICRQHANVSIKEGWRLEVGSVGLIVNAAEAEAAMSAWVKTEPRSRTG
jgi:hypothetical protein